MRQVPRKSIHKECGNVLKIGGKWVGWNVGCGWAEVEIGLTCGADGLKVVLEEMTSLQMTRRSNLRFSEINIFMEFES